MSNSEIFRFSVIRPPKRDNSFEPNEASPSSLENDIAPLMAEGKSGGDIVNILKLVPDQLVSVAKSTSIYELAEEIDELTWENLEEYFKSEKRKTLGNSQKPSSQNSWLSIIADAYKMKTDKSDSILDSIKRAVKHPSFRKGNIKVHDAWLILRITDSSSWPSDFNNMKKALSIASLLRYIARGDCLPNSSVLNKMLRRKIRISHKILNSARSSTFKAKYSSGEWARGLSSDLVYLKNIFKLMKQPRLVNSTDLNEFKSLQKNRLENHNKPLEKLNDLFNRYAALVDLKRISVQAMDEQFNQNALNLRNYKTEKSKNQNQSSSIKLPGIFARFANYLFGSNKALESNKIIFNPEAYTQSVAALATSSPILSTNDAMVSLYSGIVLAEGLLPEWVQIEKDICGVRSEIASYQPVSTMTLACSQIQQINEATPFRVLGFMDLIRATERLIDNDACEIAHIENRAGGETRERYHTIFESNENLQTTESEEETEETRDLQTSKRFELQNEAQRTIEREFSVEGSVNASVSYGMGIGGSFQLDTSLTAGYNNSVSESRRSATNITRQVIDHSISNMRTRNRRVETARVLRTTEERNRHAFETPGDSKSDIYLWVEKIHEISLKNYGKRLLLEFIIPEPGAALAFKYNQIGIDGPPQEFTVTASEINETNYLELAHRYGARNISPPPQEYLLAGAGHHAVQDPKSFAYSTKVKIPPGYIPIKVLVSTCIVSSDWMYGYYDTGFVRVSFAGQILCAEWGSPYGGGEFIVPLPEMMSEVDPQSEGLYMTISCGYHFQVRTVDLNAAVICRRSCRAYQVWQLDTHDRIYTAYQTKLAEYEEKNTANPASAVIGGHPNKNREVERRELKRLAISILNGAPPQFDLYSGSFPDIDSFLLIPEIDEIPALREALDLFENSLEWEQATYTLYPYFWGNIDRWTEKTKFNIPDSKHKAFLEAGAVRLIVPVTPNRERRILDYLVLQEASTLLQFTDIDEPTELTAEDIYSDILDELPPPFDETEDETWESILVQMNEDLTRGTGTLTVTTESDRVTVNAGNPMTFDPYLDRGRAIWINAQEYYIESVDQEGKAITLERPYSGPYSDSQARYAIGARLLGAPWRIRVPTSLVVLAQYRDQIRLNRLLVTSTNENGSSSDGHGEDG